MEYVLETRDLVFHNMISYPDMQIPSGMATFITGASGSGKSTLLRLFNGTLTPSAGDILYNDINIKDMDTIELRRNVLLAGQSVFLFDTTIRDNFHRFYECRDLPALTDNEIQQFMEICCADFPLDNDVLTMSGGERQRIFIAICLSFMPTVLMIDEPTAALDQQNAAKLLHNTLAFSKEKGMTILIVSHDKTLIENFSENTIVINKLAQEIFR